MHKPKVLIGGVEPVFCDVRNAAREFWGYEVIAAADGKQACAALRAQQVDVCILDWNLPRVAGLAVCQWIRSVALKTQPHIILLTEQERPEQIQMAYTAGADDFLVKPFNAEDLHFLVSSFVQKVSRLDIASHQLIHVDPLELYRRDLSAPGFLSRL